jgi:hypothetical protein
VWGPLVGAILAGPMTWLGLVDTAEHNGKVPNFAVRPASSLLAGYPIEHLSTGKAPWLRIRADSYGTEGTAFVTVLVPAGSPDDGTHALLAAIADVVDASREGIQYKLNVERLRVCFEEGLTGPLLIEMLSARAGGAIPREVRAIIEHWWNSYGTIRLYDNLVLLELGDDVLLHELLATSSLPAALIHQFGPRVVAVDPSRVDDLIAELIRLGYTPRLVDDTDQPAAPRR